MNSIKSHEVNTIGRINNTLNIEKCLVMESKIHKTHHGNRCTETCLQCRDSLLRFKKLEFNLKKSHELLKKLKTAEEKLQSQKKIITIYQTDEIKNKETQQSMETISDKTEVKIDESQKMKTRQSTATKLIDIHIRNDLFIENARINCLNCSKTEEKLFTLKSELDELNAKLKELEKNNILSETDENETGEKTRRAK